MFSIINNDDLIDDNDNGFNMLESNNYISVSQNDANGSVTCLEQLQMFLISLTLPCSFNHI